MPWGGGDKEVGRAVACFPDLGFKFWEVEEGGICSLEEDDGDREGEEDGGGLVRGVEIRGGRVSLHREEVCRYRGKGVGSDSGVWVGGEDGVGCGEDDDSGGFGTE